MSEHHPMSRLCRRVTAATTPIIFDLNPKVTLDHVADELDRLHARIAELETENDRLREIKEAVLSIVGADGVYCSTDLSTMEVPSVLWDDLRAALTANKNPSQGASDGK